MSPLELIVIAVVVIVFLLMGPKKIPELARSLGLARKEFAKGVSESSAVSPDSTKGPSSSGEAALVETAKKLGIGTEGRTNSEISDEIVRKVQTPG